MRSLLYPKYASKICNFVAVLFALLVDIPVKTFILWAFRKKNSKENYFEIND